MNGGNGSEDLYGEDGWDKLSGGGWADTVDGGDGADSLSGGSGADTVDAGRADGFEDYVDCGPGNDWFSVGPEDTVVNCELEF